MATKIVFRTHFNADKFPKRSTIIKDIHLTRPNMSYTIEELFEIHENNLRLPIQEFVPYFDDLDIDDFNELKQPQEDIIDWFNRLSDADTEAVLNEMELRRKENPKADEDIAREPKEGANERSEVETD